MSKLKLLLVLGLLGLNWNVFADEKATPKTEQTVTETVTVEVYRSPSCGCCGKWIAHLQENKFQVKDIVIDDIQSIKDKYGVPKEMASCHTAIVNSYVVEGHVPANDIRKLLNMKPSIIGIAVPGMPAGTPGMEMGGKKDSYQVMSFDKEHHYQVFTDYEDGQ